MTEEFDVLMHLQRVRKRARQVTADLLVEGVTLEGNFWVEAMGMGITGLELL